MKITFCGAAREVTGSCHLIEWHGRRLLLDCGLVQGGKERHERNREPFPFRPADLDLVVLSHAHIDHGGRLPALRKAGYEGPILATTPTVALAGILLPDSGKIQEEDAFWKIKRLKKRGEDYSWVKPLYTKLEAQETLAQFTPIEFDEPYRLDGAGEVRLRMAGHILGAAIVELTLSDEHGTRRVVYTGDLGTDGARLMASPTRVACPDLLLLESTYGNRTREDGPDKTELLLEIIQRTVARGGNVVIPSFAVGRTQAVLARLNDLVESGRLTGVPVYVDSPMAVAATKVFTHHPEGYSAEAQRLLREGDEPLDFPGLSCTESVEESKAIAREQRPCIIISASGMATAGRIKHHLKNNIGDERNTVVFVGYQAQGTLGRLIQEGTESVRIFGDWYPVAAEVATVEGFSAHADRDDLLAWYESLGGVPPITCVVHGEAEVAVSFGELLRQRFGGRVEVPERGQSLEL